MVHTVEELFQVQADTIAIAPVCVVLHSMQRVMGTAVRTEAEAVITELT